MLSVRCKKGTPIRSAISLKSQMGKIQVFASLTDKLDRLRRIDVHFQVRLEYPILLMVDRIHQCGYHGGQHQ